jgi:non-specific serine/threonine protein kinase
MGIQAVLDEAQRAVQHADQSPTARASATARAGHEPLSRREEEVVALLADGLTNRQIGERLVISERTVEAHVTHVLAKLSLHSRAQVAAWAVEHRLARAPAPDLRIVALGAS